MLSRKAVCLWLLAGAVCVALAAGAAGLAQQPGPGAPAADPTVAAQPGQPLVAQGDGAVAVMGGGAPPAQPPQPVQAGARVGEDSTTVLEIPQYMVPGVQAGTEGPAGAGSYGGSGGGYGAYGGSGRGAVMYGPGRGAVGPGYHYSYATVGHQKPDPEMEQLLKKDAEMETQVQALVKQWHEQKDEKARADLRTQVEKLSKEHFDLRQQRRELELSRLEAQLERVRTSIKKRAEVKDLIIQRRIARLLGEEDDLAF
jgi:hypothetical protein